MEEFVTKNGGKVSTSVSSKTYLLVHADDVDKSSNKYESAVKYEIKIMSKSEFKKSMK
jgi:NAD-dependent DNA ligase